MSHAPEPHDDGPSEEPVVEPDPAEAALIARVEALVGDVAEHHTRMVPRWRRLVRTLHGLGILGIVGPDWVRITPDGLSFAPLDPKAADRLAHHLEDLEFELAPIVPEGPMPDEPMFDFPPLVPPPSAPVRSHHLGVRP